MKKCFTCNKEYDDEDIFCPICGEKLVATNVCQKCGKPVSAEDIYCRHCGHKIEKEIRCEKCNAVIPEGSKFCPQCGTSVTNPSVSIVSNNKPAVVANKKKDKILFFAVYGVGLLLLLLMLIGCFGDLSTSFTKTSSLASEAISSNVSISYFFGDAIKKYSDASKQMKFFGYNAFALSKIIIDYVFWILAIVSTILGLVFSSLKMFKAQKNRDYSLNVKTIVYPALGTIPYIAIIALTNALYMSASSISESYKTELGTRYGWGTMMIFVSLIILFAILAVSKLAKSIIEKTNIASNSILCAAKIILFVLFLISFGQVLSIIYSESGSSISGYATTYSVFINYLSQYSAGTIIAKFPTYCVGLVVGLGLLLSGFLVGLPFFEKLFNGKKVLPLYIFGGFMFVLLLAGYIVSFASIKDYIKSMGTSFYGLVGDAIKISVFGIVFLFFVALSLAGVTIAKKLEKVKE